jgi:hypothetical protein
MNLQQRLDEIERRLPKGKHTSNLFAGYTDEELDQLTKELAVLVQTEIDNDPNAVNTINPRIIKHLKNEGLIKV